jgi:hypothetical protein
LHWTNVPPFYSGYYDDSINIEAYSGPDTNSLTFCFESLEAILVKAGLTDGYRRSIDGVTFIEREDPENDLGLMRVGDVIGPWIFQDLQAVFRVLIYVAEDNGFRDESYYYGSSYLVAEEGEEVTYAGAHADINFAFVSSSTGNASGPNAATYGTDYDTGSSSNATARSNLCRPYIYSRDMDGTAKYYGNARNPYSGTFNDHGTGLEFEKYVLLENAILTSGNPWKGALYGPTTKPEEAVLRKSSSGTNYYGIDGFFLFKGIAIITPTFSYI